jgi:hypothetical protein
MVKKIVIVISMMIACLTAESHARQLRILAENIAPVNFLSDGNGQAPLPKS